MTSTVHNNTRHRERGHHRKGSSMSSNTVKASNTTSAAANTTSPMELSISDLKMEDHSSQTASTVDESYNHASFDFLNRSMLVRPLADTSETSGSGVMRDPSIAELQSVFASQAKVRTSSGANLGASRSSLNHYTSSSQLLSDNSRLSDASSARISLSDRLQKRWNNHSSLSSMDSSNTSAARAGSPVIPTLKTQPEEFISDSSSDEEEEQLLQLPVLSVCSAKTPPSQPSADVSLDESLLDFESVCFEPEMATEEEKDHSRRAERTVRTCAPAVAANKYAGLSNLGKVVAIGGKKKEVLADIAALGGRRPSKTNSTSTSTSKQRRSRDSAPKKRTSREHRCRSRSPSKRGGGDRTKRSERTISASSSGSKPRRQRSSNKMQRDDSPPPLVESPREGTVRRTRTVDNAISSSSKPDSLRRTKTETIKSSSCGSKPEVRRVKSTETPRPTTSYYSKSSNSNNNSNRSKPRRAKSSDAGALPARRKAGHHQGRIPPPSLQEAAMEIDLDDITASQHSPDYYYLDDTTAEDDTAYADPNDESVRSNLMEDIVEAVKAKDEDKQRKSSVMESLLTMLLDDIGQQSKKESGGAGIGVSGSSPSPERKQPRKPRRVRSTTSKKSSSATTDHSSQSGGSTSSSGNSGNAKASRRRKQSKDPAATGGN